MNPKKAITKIVDRGWTFANIGDHIQVNRVTIYRIMNSDQTPSYKTYAALLKLAKSRLKPPSHKRIARTET